MSSHEIFAFYFPQFYPIPENDLWWGDGFTDWKLVRESKEIDSCLHRQPRVPTSLLNYYDQSKPDIIKKQAELARDHNITGFNFYHYWFDGKVLLDQPMVNLLTEKSIDIDYFFTWANETWTRQWVGKPNDVLMKQEHKAIEELWHSHYEYLSKFFKDPRYKKITNKPIFCIYRPELINDLDRMISFLNTMAKSDGFDGIHWIAFRSYEISNHKKIYSSFDGLANFQPRLIVNKYLKSKSMFITWVEKILRTMPEKIQLLIVSLFLNRKKHKVYDYRSLIEFIDADLKYGDTPVYPSICPDWDNSARYGESATFFSHVTPDLFELGLQKLKFATENYSEKIIFINAWNEWSESAYLEPDTFNGDKLLQIVKKNFSS